LDRGISIIGRGVFIDYCYLLLSQSWLNDSVTSLAMMKLVMMKLVIFLLLVWRANSLDYFKWPPCQRGEVPYCEITWLPEFGYTYSCDMSSNYMEVPCMHTLSHRDTIGTLEIYGDDFLPVRLRAFRLIVPTMHTFILRDTVRPIELSHLMRFLPELHRVRLLRSNITTNYLGQSVPAGVRILTGVTITHPEFRIEKFGLYRVRNLEVTTAEHINHDPRFFWGGELKELNYTNAQLLRFDWDDFPPGMRHLEELTINFPRVISLVGQMPFHRLRRLTINTGNAIYYDELLDIDFPGLDNLKDIVFRQVQGLNRISTFPANISSISIIDSAIMSLNPRTWGRLRKLRKLHIIRSNLMVIDEKFFALYPALTELDLSDNKLVQFAISDEHLMKLSILNLSSNNLDSISYTLIDRPRLLLIDLANNNIRKIGIPSKDFLKHESQLISVNFSGSSVPCSCDLSIFCALLNNQTLVEGVCSRKDSHYQRMCTNDYSMCAPATLSRSSRSLKSELEELRNLSQSVTVDSFDSSEQEVHETLVKLGNDNQIETNSKNSLRANYGVGFQFRGKLYGSVEKFKLHINVHWKSFALPKFQWNLKSFQKLCDQSDQLVKSICQDFVPLVKQATSKVDHYSEELKSKLRRISSLVTGDISKARPVSKKKKRDIFEPLRSLNYHGNTSALMKDTNETYIIDLDVDKWNDENYGTKLYSGFFPRYGGVRAINQQQDRNKVMVTAIRTMSAKQDLVKNAYVELQSDLAMAVALVADNFETTTSNIRLLHKLLNDTNFEILDIFNAMGSSLNILQQKVHGIRILSILTTKYLDLWAKQVHNYFVLNMEADRLLDAVMDLSIGKISPHLLPPDKLKEIIAHVTKSLSEWHKDYVLVYDRLSQFYYHSDILYLPTARGIMIQLLWPVQARISKQYDLFLVSSVHMPAVTTPRYVDAEANHDFSKIDLSRKYLGVSDTNFVELGFEELDKCLIVDDAYFCYQVLFELDRSKLSCLTALYMNATVEEIGNLCPVNYYFSPFVPESTIIDAGSQLLVSGLVLPWTQRCLGDRIPRKAEGSLYAILERDSLCFCSIDAPNGYLSQRITGCDHLANDKQPAIQLSYALNSLVVANFKEELNITFEDLYGNAPPDFIIPKFTMAQTVAEAKLMNMSSGIMKLRSLSELLKEKRDIFKNEWDELSAFFSFGSLFSPKYWFRAVSFVGSIAGFLSLIALIYMICRTRYQQGFIQSLMFAHGAKAINMDDLCGEGKLQIDLTNRSLLYLMIAHVGLILLIMLLIYSGKRLVSLFCREARVLIAHPTLRKYPEVEIFLELHAGCEKVLLYVLTIKAHFSKVELKGHMTPRSLVFDNHRMYGVIRPNWKREDCKVVIEGIEVELPNMIQVPLYKKRKVQSILKNVFTCSILATDGLYLYKIGDRKHEVVAEKSLNPYSALISELRERERAFEAIPVGPKSFIQTAEVEMEPTAPVPSDSSFNSVDLTYLDFKNV